MKTGVIIALLLLCCFVVCSCKDKPTEPTEPLPGWINIQGYDFPIYMGKLGGVYYVDEQGSYIGFYEVGDSTGYNDENDWKVFDYNKSTTEDSTTCSPEDEIIRNLVSQ